MFIYLFTVDPVPGTTMTFSSYPGTLMSGDDFYLLDSGLVSNVTAVLAFFHFLCVCMYV